MRDLCRACTGTTVVLNAWLPVLPFYERLGYAITGPAFTEAGIPHRAMSKRLT
jgi:predicted GNAT family N-acyltransferase